MVKISSVEIIFDNMVYCAVFGLIVTIIQIRKIPKKRLVISL